MEVGLPLTAVRMRLARDIGQTDNELHEIRVVGKAAGEF
jgi:hypothetical protein